MLPLAAEFGAPLWVFGQAIFGFTGDDEIVATCIEQGVSRLLRIDLARATAEPLATPFTDLDDLTNGGEDASSRGLDNGGSGSDGSNGSGPPSAGFFYDDGQDGDFKGHIENFFGKDLGDKISNIGGLTTQLTFLNDIQVSAILRAVEKSSEFQLVNDQVLSVHNTERAFVSVINQRAYIQDFDVEVAQFQAVADPQVNVLTEGVVLDVRPTILYDRKYVRLENGHIVEYGPMPEEKDMSYVLIASSCRATACRGWAASSARRQWGPGVGGDPFGAARSELKGARVSGPTSLPARLECGELRVAHSAC